MHAWLPALIVPLALTLQGSVDPRHPHDPTDAVSSLGHASNLHRPRWVRARSGGWTLGLSYSIERARSGRQELAVKYPDVEVEATVESRHTIANACDASQGCSDVGLREVIIAAERVAEAVGSFHWVERFGSIELMTGVILPEASAPLNDMDTVRL